MQNYNLRHIWHTVFNMTKTKVAQAATVFSFFCNILSLQGMQKFNLSSSEKKLTTIFFLHFQQDLAVS